MQAQSWYEHVEFPRQTEPLFFLDIVHQRIDATDNRKHLPVYYKLMRVKYFVLQFSLSDTNADLCGRLIFLLLFCLRIWQSFFPAPSDQTGVEQLSALQHLDLAYNLLLEHSQLAPLSQLHCLSTVRKHVNACVCSHVLLCVFLNFFSGACMLTQAHWTHDLLSQLNLEGNPLCFQKSHRNCTVRHLSPKAATGRVRNHWTRFLMNKMARIWDL